MGHITVKCRKPQLWQLASNQPPMDPPKNCDVAKGLAIGWEPNCRYNAVGTIQCDARLLFCEKIFLWIMGYEGLDDGTIINNIPNCGEYRNRVYVNPP